MESTQYDIMYEVEATHFWYRGMRTIAKSLFEKYVTKKKNRILDAGCGTGQTLLFLKTYGKVDGFDISDKAVKLCHKRGLKQVIKGSIEAIPFKSNTFDVVTCFDVLGQKQVSSDKRAIKEFYRVLKPGGVLFIRTAAFNFLYGYHDKAVHTKMRYTTNQLRQLFQYVSFDELKITYVNFFFMPFIALIRYISSLMGIKKLGESDVNRLNPILNTIFYYPLFFESILIRFVSLPFGLSIIGLAKKPSGKAIR